MVSSNKKYFLSGFAPILILILVVAAVGGAYYFGTLKNKSNTPVSDQTNKETAIPSSNPTANWKTYSYQKAGLTFKYPNNWFAKQISNVGNIYLDDHQFEVPSGVEFMTPIELNFDNDIKATTERISNLFSPSVNQTKMVVGGRQSTQFSGYAGPGQLQGKYLSYTLIPLEQGVAIVSLSDKNLEGLYSQILSTFKFVEENDDSLKILSAVKIALKQTYNKEIPASTDFAKDKLKIMDGWAFGTVVIPASGTPEAHYFLAKKENNWQAAIEYTQAFKDWIGKTPDGLINPDLKKALQ